FDLKKKRRILWKLNAAELFETFLHSHYVGQKRFSLEGGEMLIPLLDAIIERSAHFGVKEIVLGMPHRGRLNVLANILDKPYGMIFNEFEGNLPKTVAGDGLVAETLNLSQLPGYKTGGTIHLVVNNQIGFTTSPIEGRSTRYCTDVAKMIEVPIFHVNGEAPEEAVYAAELATDFREEF